MGIFSSLFGGNKSKASFFRNMRDPIFGQLAIDGINTLSNERIDEIYAEVKAALGSIAEKKGEVIPDSVINGLVRDMLEFDVHGVYAEQLEQSKQLYSELPIKTLFMKGRSY